MISRAFAYEIPDEQYRSKLLRKLQKDYPFLHIGTLSKSVCGRSIPYVAIGNPSEQVLMAGAFHGMEWLTSLLLIHFIKELCEAIKHSRMISEIKVAEFLKQRGVFFLPCINPDGVEISLHGAESAGEYQKLVTKASGSNTSRWQANARGVDINHNFDAGWQELHELEQKSGIIGPAPTRYGGKKPESEPETKAITTFCRFSNIRHALAFHSQGEEIYWSFGENTPKRSELMVRIMAMSSGYKASQPEGLAVGGGFKDWFIKEKKRPAFTIEIGKGENPLPLDDLEEIYYALEEMLVLSLIM